MKVKNIIRLAFHVVLVAIAIVATVFTFTDRIADGRPIDLFYTAWSVWFAAAAAIAVLVLDIVSIFKKNDVTHGNVDLLQFCALIMMLATFIVSAFVLPDKIWTANYWNAGSIFKHFLLPILTIADVVLFTRKNAYGKFYPLYGVVPSLIYWFITICRASIVRDGYANGTFVDPVLGENAPLTQWLWNMFYPYGFTNIDKGKSLGGLIGLLAGIMVGLIAFGFGFYFLKKYFSLMDTKDNSQALSE